MEKLREVGRPVVRVDAYDKVTGRAKFTDDLCPKPCLEAKIYHATIGNGVVKSIDTSEAEKVPGIVAVFTCFDVPDICYPVAGHPWYADSAAAKRDQADRKLLDSRVRIYGDNIAVVVGEDTVCCDRALKKIKVEYEEYPVVYDPIESMKGTNPPVQDRKPDNIVAHSLARTSEENLARAGYKTVEEALETAGADTHFNIAQPIDLCGSDHPCVITSTVTDWKMGEAMSAIEDGSFGGGKVIEANIDNGGISLGKYSDAVPQDVQDKVAEYTDQIKADTLVSDDEVEAIRSGL